MQGDMQAAVHKLVAGIGPTEGSHREQQRRDAVVAAGIMADAATTNEGARQRAREYAELRRLEAAAAVRRQRTHTKEAPEGADTNRIREHTDVMGPKLVPCQGSQGLLRSQSMQQTGEQEQSRDRLQEQSTQLRLQQKHKAVEQHGRASEHKAYKTSRGAEATGAWVGLHTEPTRTCLARELQSHGNEQEVSKNRCAWEKDAMGTDSQHSGKQYLAQVGRRKQASDEDVRKHMGVFNEKQKYHNLDMRQAFEEAAARVFKGMREDDSDLALRPDDSEDLTQAVQMVHSLMADAYAASTSKQDWGSHWNWWTLWCKQWNTRPIRYKRLDNMNSWEREREIYLMAAAIPWILYRMKGRGRMCGRFQKVRPRSFGR